MVLKKKRKTRQKKITPIKAAKVVEVAYRRELLNLVAGLKGAVDLSILELEEGFTADAKKPAARALLLIKQLKLKEKELLRKIDSMASRFVFKGDKINQKKFTSVLKKDAGIDVGLIVRKNPKISKLLKTRISENTQLIKNLSSDYVARIEEDIVESMTSGTPLELFQKLKQSFGITENRAKLIARDQTSKVFAALNEARQKSLGIVKYRWITASDKAVRKNHKKLHNTIHLWDEPPIVNQKTKERANPGEEIQCRCLAQAIFDLDEMFK